MKMYRIMTMTMVVTNVVNFVLFAFLICLICTFTNYIDNTNNLSGIISASQSQQPPSGVIVGDNEEDESPIDKIVGAIDGIREGRLPDGIHLASRDGQRDQIRNGQRTIDSATRTEVYARATDISSLVPSSTLINQPAKPEPPAVLISDTSNVTKVSNATVEELNAAIAATCPWMSSYNSNLGQLYHDLEEEYGINAYFALAVSYSEVGTQNMSRLAREDNNIYGLMTGVKYDSLEDCIDYFFRLIKKNYVGQGRLSVEDISKKYCNGNPTWIKNVSYFMNELPDRCR